MRPATEPNESSLHSSEPTTGSTSQLDTPTDSPPPNTPFGESEAPPSLVAGAEEQPPPLNCDTDLLITELLVNPKATVDNLGEFVEVYNPSEAPADLRGWTLLNGHRQTVRFEADEPLWIAPRTAAVLAPSLNPDENGELHPIASLGSWSLPNQGGVVRLVNPCGQTVARLRYTAKAPWRAGRPGVAIELRSADAPVDDPGSWRRAQKRWVTGDYATPGVWAPRHP